VLEDEFDSQVPTMQPLPRTPPMSLVVKLADTLGLPAAPPPSGHTGGNSKMVPIAGKLQHNPLRMVSRTERLPGGFRHPAWASSEDQ
jgi:hypothetical protein